MVALVICDQFGVLVFDDCPVQNCANVYPGIWDIFLFNVPAQFVYCC